MNGLINQMEPAVFILKKKGMNFRMTIFFTRNKMTGLNFFQAIERVAGTQQKEVVWELNS